jgi:hypothetical protein
LYLIKYTRGFDGIETVSFDGSSFISNNRDELVVDNVVLIEFSIVEDSLGNIGSFGPGGDRFTNLVESDINIFTETTG